MVQKTEGASEHYRGVALALEVPLGLFGAHRFYVGRTRSGTIMFLTVGGLALWWLYDMIVILAGQFRDAQGKRVVRWLPQDLLGYDARAQSLAPREVEEEVAMLRSEVSELAERVDFLERLLIQLRERSSLPPRGTGP